jgi:hypothetical protein
MTAMITPFDRILPEDLYDGFDPDDAPDPAEFWDADLMGPNEEWNRLRSTWVKVKAYRALHAPKHVPMPDAYEIPRPARQWADKIIQGGPIKPLLMSGVVGVGKTHGASALACYLAAFWDSNSYVDAPPIAFHKASRLVGQLKNFGNAKAREDLYFEVTHAKVLVIDDLTRFKLTDFDMESLGEVVDEREGTLPTVFTLNHDPAVELSELMPAFLASRLGSGQECAILGTDRRA